MVSSRTRTTTQRGLVKVKKARIVVMMMLILVAVAIVLIDKKDTVGHEEVIVNAESSRMAATVSGVSNENHNVTRTETFSNPVISGGVIAQSTNEFKPVEMPKTPVVENKISEIVSPIKDITVPKVSELSVKFGNTESMGMAKTSEKAEKSKKGDSNKVATVEKKKLTKNNDSRSKMKEPDGNFHIVQKGETLSKISEKVYGTQKLWLSLLNANRDVLSSAKDLKPGQKIRVPSLEEIDKLVGHSKRVSPKSQSHEYNFVETPSGKAKPSVAEKNVDIAKNNGEYYYVSEGDTLETIAKKIGVSFLKLYDLNKHIQDNPNKLLKGTKIRLPLASPNH